MERDLKLPKIQDLEMKPSEAFKQDQLKLILNAQPPEKWIKDHPFAKNVKYIPIDKVEYLLDRIFQQWKAEVIEYKQLFNSVSCHVRLHYFNPITLLWEFHDGLGAVGIQTDKGASAGDMSAIKSDAVMKALPAAKSYAIKDAAEHLGDLFGRNLNRKDALAFKATRNEEVYDLKTLQKLQSEKGNLLQPEDDMNILRIIEQQEESSYKKAIKLLIKL